MGVPIYPTLPPCALLPRVTLALGTSRFYCDLCTHPPSVIIFLFRPIIVQRLETFLELLNLSVILKKKKKKGKDPDVGLRTLEV